MMRESMDARLLPIEVLALDLAKECRDLTAMLNQVVVLCEARKIELPFEVQKWAALQADERLQRRAQRAPKVAERKVVVPEYRPPTTEELVAQQLVNWGLTHNKGVVGA